MARNGTRLAAACGLALCLIFAAACGGSDERESASPETAPPAQPSAEPEAAPPAESTQSAPIPEADAERGRLAKGEHPTAVAGAPTPASYGSDLPIPPGGTQVAAYDGGENMGMVVYESPEEVDAIINGLTDAYRADGWEIGISQVHETQGLILAQREDQIISAILETLPDGKRKVEVTLTSAPGAQ